MTADTTDEDPEALAEADEKLALSEGVHLIGSTLKVRTEARDEMRDEGDNEGGHGHCVETY